MLMQAARAGALLVGVRLLTRMADLITVLILARILEPQSFGLVALAMSLVSVVEAALELPLHAALVRQDVITNDHYDAAFTLGAIRGILIGFGLIAISAPFSKFYHDDRLILLVSSLSLAPVVRGLISPRLASYQKELSFWRDFTIEAAGKLFGVAVAITFALTTRSYWAIAAGVIASPVGMTATSYMLAPHRPRLSVKELPAFIEFLGWNSAAQMISAVNWQIERLVLGKLQSATQLGLFTAGNDIAGIPFLSFFGPIFRPMYAAFAQSKNDIEQLRQDYTRISSIIIMLGLPFLLGESALAAPMVHLILGDKWTPAVPLVFWLSLSFIPGLFTLASTALFMALGKTTLLFRRNLVEFICKLPLVIYGAIAFGFMGIVIARVASELAANLFSLIMVRRMIGLRLRDQLMIGWRSVLSALVMLVPILICDRLLPDGPANGLAFSRIGTSVLVGAPTYFLVHWWLWKLAKQPKGVESMIWLMAQEAISKRNLPLSK